jgi:hypothetical protein
MKVSSLIAGIAFAASLLFATSALASDHGNLQIFQEVTVNGVQLKPGQYKLEWNGASKDTHVKIFKGKDLLASAPAKIVPSASQQEDGYTMRKTKSGKDDLTGVFFGGKDWTLQIEPHSSLKTAQQTHAS